MSDPVVAPIAQSLQRIAVEELQRQRLPGLAVGVVRDGALAWSLGAGRADDAGAAPTERTLFQIASITKTFTGTAILQLRDAGLLRLDDPVSLHVPEAAAIANPFGPIEDVTIRRLLSHESGLQGEVTQDDPRRDVWVPRAEILARTSRLTVAIPPSTATKYSNVGYMLLGQVVENRSGLPYQRYVRERIIEPLGLVDTAFEPPLAQRAQGYLPTRLTDAPGPARTIVADLSDADGGLWSTVADLARWIGYQCSPDGRVLATPTVREMQACRTLCDETWSEAFGLTWYAHRAAGVSWIGHAGLFDGFASRILFEPATGVGAIALSNGVHGDSTAVALPLAQAARAAHVAAGPPVPSGPVPPAPDAIVPLLGSYRFEHYGAEATFAWHDGGFVLLQEGVAQPLAATADPLAWIVATGREAGERVLFLRDDDGAVRVVNVAQIPMYRAG